MLSTDFVTRVHSGSDGPAHSRTEMCWRCLCVQCMRMYCIRPLVYCMCCGNFVCGVILNFLNLFNSFVLNCSLCGSHLSHLRISLISISSHLISSDCVSHFLHSVWPWSIIALLCSHAICVRSTHRLAWLYRFGRSQFKKWNIYSNITKKLWTVFSSCLFIPNLKTVSFWCCIL